MSRTQQAPSAAKRAQKTKHAWKKPFLAALGELSNVSKAAKAAEVSTATVYDLRRRDRAFRQAWQAALCEGYDNLEMELLFRLREGEIKRAAGAKTGVRTFDNATSFRLLAVHRDAVDRGKAQRSNVSVADVRASIERKVAALKAQVVARLEAEEAAQAEGARGDGEAA